MQTLKPVGELISSSWSAYKKDFKNLIRILSWYLVFTAGSVILSIIGLSFEVAPAAEILLSLALVISTIICIPALLEYVASEQKISVSQAFKQSRPRIWPFIWTGFLSGLVVLGGCSLLLIPGIYLAICFCFSQYLVISEKKSGAQALWESAKLVKGQWFAVFLRVAIYSLAIWALVFVASWLDGAINAQGYLTNTMTLVISFFGPLFMLYFYKIYKNLRSINKADDTKIPTKTRALYTVLSVIGVVVPTALVIAGGILIADTIGGNSTWSGGEIQNQYEQYLNSAIAEQASEDAAPLSTD